MRRRESDESSRMKSSETAHGGTSAAEASSPFRLEDEAAYEAWREVKLASYPKAAEQLRVRVADLANPTSEERAAIVDRCAVANMAIYDSGKAGADPRRVRAALPAFAAAFGLRQREDHRSQGENGVVAIEVAAAGGRAGYIPYSTKPLSWHTDGYYNFHGAGDCVQAMVLHCVRDASEGGVNAFLDHEIAYIRLRDRDPDFIAALMHRGAMTIPAGEDGRGGPRPDNTGPVFFMEPLSGAPVMRYTARKRHVVWRDDAATRAAVKALEDVLESDPLILRYKLRPGEGTICNNILHNRSGFSEGEGAGRLLYRVRYHDRMSIQERQA
jgi:alpha-ketoglutarate-dependent taurine dioxygenase